MSLESKTLPQSEIKTSGGLLIRPNELRFFNAALERFIGFGFEIQSSITSQGIIVPERCTIKGEGAIVIEKIRPVSSNNHFKTNNQLFDFVYRCHLLENDPQQVQVLRNYLEEAGTLIVIRRTSPSERFKHSLLDHSEKYHGGLAILEILAAFQGMHIIENNHDDWSRPQTPVDEEQRSLQNLVEIAKESLNFFAITPTGDKQIPDEVKEAVDQLNSKSDPYEFAYDVFLTMDTIEKSQNIFAQALLGLGIASPWVFKSLSKTIGELPTMVSSQMIGEVLTMVYSSADRMLHHLPHIKTSEMRLLLSQALINFPQLPMEIKRWVIGQAANIKNLNETIRKRLEILALNLSFATGLSALALLVNHPLPLLVTAPLNATLINRNDIEERQTTAKKIVSGLTGEENQVVEDYLKDKSPRLLRSIVKKNPSLAIAFLDFAANKPAFYSWMGSFVSLGLLGAVTLIDPHRIPEEWIMGLSGLIFENLLAVLGGLRSASLDPWDKFIDTLPLLYQLRTNQ